MYIENIYISERIFFKYYLFYPKYSNSIKVRIREMFEPIADSLEEGTEKSGNRIAEAEERRERA